MEHTRTIHCPRCNNSDLQKNGHSRNGTQCFLCKNRGRAFRSSYRYRAREPGVKEKMDDMALNGSGARDTARVPGTDKGTVIAHLKKNAPYKPLSA